MTSRETVKGSVRNLLLGLAGVCAWGVTAALSGCGTDSAIAIDPPSPVSDGGSIDSGGIRKDATAPDIPDSSIATDATPSSHHDAAIDATDATDASCPTDCGPGRACCNGACVDTRNDPHNCGGCGVACPDDKNWCDATDPTISPFCNAQVACAADYNPPLLCPGYPAAGLCCGYECCARDELCCTSQTVSPGLGCFKPTVDQPTCPPLPPGWPFASNP